MPALTIPGDAVVQGNLYAKTITLPVGSVGNSQVSSSSPITTNKLYHQYKEKLTQAHGTAAITERRVIHVAEDVGSVYTITAGLVIACIGAATIVIDLKKNGVSILAATFTLDNANAAYIPEDGSILTPDYVADDVLELFVTATAGGGTLGQGLFVNVTFRELPG